MKYLKFIIGAVLFCGAVFSCSKQDRENDVIDQEKRIDTYLESLGDLSIVRRDGVARIVRTSGSGADTVAAGDSVYFYYAAYLFSGGASGKGALFATNHPETAGQNHFLTDGVLEKKRVEMQEMISGLYYGLVGVRKGERCDLVFSSRYGYGNTVVYNIPKLSPLFFEIWVEEVVKK